MGRVLLAGLPEAERQVRVPQTLTARTPKSLTDRPALMSELNRVEAEGYCILDEELELGLRSLAVPIRRPDGSVAAALNVGSQSQRASREVLIETFLPALKAASDLLAPALSGRGLAP